MSGRWRPATRPVAGITIVAAAVVAIGSGSSPVTAAPASFTKVPTRLYMVPAEHSTVVPDVLAGLFVPIDHMMFDDLPVTGDVISHQSRVIEVSADNAAGCNHHGTDGTGSTGDPADDFSLTGCTALQLEVGNGTLTFDPAPQAETDPRDPTADIYRFASGALLRDADEAADLERPILALIGTAAEINQTIKTLVYTPTVDDPSTPNVDEDYYYDGSDPESLSIDLVPGNGDPGPVTRDVQIRVLDYNDFPTVDVPQEQWAIAAPNTGDDVALFSPDDGNPPANPSLAVADDDNDEVTDDAQDGDDPDGDPGDGDDPDDGTGDEFLVIAWATCGKFSLISSNGFAWGDDLEHVIDYVYDQFGDPLANDPADKDTLIEALLAAIPDDVEQLPFANVNPTNPTSALVAVADDISSVNYNLGRITFHPVDDVNQPLQDTTCHVRALISDLGNNGLPFQYIGEPESGLEIPMLGVDLDANYVPAVEQLTVEIGDGGATTPTITSVADVSAAEGDAATTPFAFTLSLDVAASGDESVDVAAVHTGPAPNTDDTDFVPPAPQTVTFPAGSSSVTVTIPVNGDTTIEDDEHFELLLSNPQNVAIGDSSGFGIVMNDDPDPGVQIDSFTDVTLAEGNAGTTAFELEIGLSAPAPPGGVSVRVTTNHVTTDAADLSPLVNQLVLFPQGTDIRTVTVEVNGDTEVELAETFTATLSNPIGASIAAAATSATGTIATDDLRAVSITDVTMAEGSGGGTTAFVFTLTLDGPALAGTSVDVATAAGTAGAADFTGLTQTVNFVTGAQDATVAVEVAADDVDESDETFTLALSNPINMVIADGLATGTIQNDDGPLRHITAISPVTTAEGDAGTTDFVFTLTLDGPAVGTEGVVATRTNGTTDDTDFVDAVVPVVFTSGQSTATAVVHVRGDVAVEADETFTLMLSGAQNVVIDAPGTATGTIQNDDLPDPLMISVPADITVPHDPGDPGAVVTYAPPTTTGGVAPVMVNCSHASGDFYPIGATVVTCTATDSAPSQQQQFALAVVSDTFTITVTDTDDPDPSSTTSSSTTTPPDSTAPPGSTPPPSGTGVPVPTTIPPANTFGPGQLPATGGSPGGPLALAALTCGVGVVLALVRRRSWPAPR